MFRMSEKTRQAYTELRDAQRALNDLPCGHDYECDEYLAAHDRVIAAEKPVPWYLQLVAFYTA